MISVTTITGYELPGEMVSDYFHNLVNRFFKILPMRENGEESLNVYMRSLSTELAGFVGLMPHFASNSFFITLLSIIEYLIDNPDCDLDVVKREVFRAISICNKLEKHFSPTLEV